MPHPHLFENPGSRAGKCNLQATARRGFEGLFGTVPSMPKDNAQPEHRVDQHERVGNHKDPILERPTVDGKTERSGNLADK